MMIDMATGIAMGGAAAVVLKDSGESLKAFAETWRLIKPKPEDVDKARAAILAAQESLAGVLEQNTVLHDKLNEARATITTLEQEITTMTQFDADVDKYQMVKGKRSGMLGYVLKESIKAGKEEIPFCADCFDNRKKARFRFVATELRHELMQCPLCEAIWHGERADQVESPFLTTGNSRRSDWDNF